MGLGPAQIEKGHWAATTLQAVLGSVKAGVANFR